MTIIIFYKIRYTIYLNNDLSMESRIERFGTSIACGTRYTDAKRAGEMCMYNFFCCLSRIYLNYIK